MNYLSELTIYSDWGLFVLRVTVGVIFLVHGFKKMAMWKMQPSAQMPSGMINTMRFLSVVEPLGGLAVLVGFLTSWAALGLSIIMIGAMYLKIVKWKTPFYAQNTTGWELDLIILASNIVLLTMGPGLKSIDYMLGWM